jgi:hypothetical protein
LAEMITLLKLWSTLITHVLFLSPQHHMFSRSFLSILHLVVCMWMWYCSGVRGALWLSWFCIILNCRNFLRQ